MRHKEEGHGETPPFQGKKTITFYDGQGRSAEVSPEDLSKPTSTDLFHAGINAISQKMDPVQIVPQREIDYQAVNASITRVRAEISKYGRSLGKTPIKV